MSQSDPVHMHTRPQHGRSQQHAWPMPRNAIGEGGKITTPTKGGGVTNFASLLVVFAGVLLQVVV